MPSDADDSLGSSSIPKHIYGWFEDNRTNSRNRCRFHGSFLVDAQFHLQQGVIIDDYGLARIEEGYFDSEQGLLSFRKTYVSKSALGNTFSYHFLLNPITQIYEGDYECEDRNGKTACMVTSVDSKLLKLLIQS